jgi:uncharacterized cupin superfamily protein
LTGERTSASIAAMIRPTCIVSTADVQEEDGGYPGSDEVTGHGRPIGEAAGLQRIGLHIERVEPGERTSYPHAEESLEEFVYVISGTIDAWIDGALHPMKAGDLAAFPAGTGICHSFLNNGDETAVLLVGGEASRPDNRTYYPLHPERREQMAAGRWWDLAAPPQLGPHDGKPHRKRGV